MKFQKKHIVLGTLIIALGAAVYINWQFASNQNLERSSNELGSAQYVNATSSTEKTSTYDQVEVTSNMTGEQQAYFANARNERDQTQDKIIDTANEVLSSDKSSDDDKNAAIENIKQLLKNFTYQDSIESILKAKGFTQCLCYISDQGCNVIVLKDEMNDTSAVMIKAAVTSQIDMSFDSITIVEV